MLSLSELQPEERGTVCQVNGNGAVRKRLLDMGVVPGAEIAVIRVAPLGDPVEYMIKGYRLSLRRSEAVHVLVEPNPCPDCPHQRECPRMHRKRHRKRGRRRWLRWLTTTRDESQNGHDE